MFGLFKKPDSQDLPHDTNDGANSHQSSEAPFERSVTIRKLLSDHPELIPVFTKHDLLCVGCLLAPFHDITDAAIEHDLDEEKLYNDLVSAAKTHHTLSEAG